MGKIKFDVKKNGIFLLSVVVLLAVFFVLNVLSPFAADDYSFMYSWEDGTRITSMSQIFETLVCVYETLIGRMISVFFCIFFLMFPKDVFNVVNTIVFVATVVLIYKLTDKKKKFSVLIFFMIPVFFWIFMPTYGQLFLWLNGSINYLWSYFFALLFMMPYISLYRNPDKKRKRWAAIGLCIYGLLFGSYVENVSFATAFVCFLMVVAVMYEKKSIKKYLWYVYPIIAAAMGFMVFLLSPGEMDTHTGSFHLGTMIKMLITIFLAYYKYTKLLLICFAIFMTMAVSFHVDKKEIGISVFCILISLVSAAVLCAGSYLAERSLGVSVFFVIVANINLMQALRNTNSQECVVYCICWYFIISNVMTFWNGSYDIFDTNRRWHARDCYIREQVSSGVKVLQVPFLEPATTFCCLYGLEDVETKESGEVWPNSVIAKYYGLDKIYRQSE